MNAFFAGSFYTAEMMQRLQPLVVPTEPGEYTDYMGHSWTLHANGEWRDETGESRPTSYNWMLVACAPFYPVDGAYAITG